METIFSKSDSTNGRIFVDRDPKMFRMVLEYLKNKCSTRDIMHGYRLLFKDELQYWGLHEPGKNIENEANKDVQQQMVEIFNTKPKWI